MSAIHGVNYGTPTLDLNFAKNKSLIDTVSGLNLVTFTRSQTAREATYVGADGLIKTAVANEPRFDHNPTTGESLGLLVEEQRTNLLIYSEEINQTGWSLSTGKSSVSTNLVASPDGNQTADLLIPNSETNYHYITKFFTFTSTNMHTYSVYAKAGGYNYLLINTPLNSTNGNSGPVINLITGVVENNYNFNYGAIVTSAGNGWWRIQFSYTPILSGSAYIDHNVLPTASVSPSSGNNTSGVYIWGAQLEVGAFPTSYIPTTGSTVTRSADVASITGTNYASFINYNEGTWVSSVPKVNGTGGRIFDSRSSILFVNASTSGYQYASGGSSTITATYPLKGAVVYNSTDVHAAANGTIKTDNTGARTASHSYIDIGSANTAAAGVGFLNGPINRLTYYPTRLQDFQLQQLTK